MGQFKSAIDTNL